MISAELEHNEPRALHQKYLGLTRSEKQLRRDMTAIYKCTRKANARKGKTC